MPAQANANVVALQLEKVRDKVPLLYERDDILLTMIQQRGDVEKVSSRNMRLPLQVNPGGKAGSYNADGGDLGRGSGTLYDVATVSPIFFRFAIEIPKLVEYATNSREKAVENAAKREVANGMKQFRAFLDKLMQTAGNGVLGTDRAEDAVAGGLHQLVEERAELFHSVGDFALGRVFHGLLARVRGVLDEFGDFNGEAEENRRDRRHVVEGAGAAAEVAAVGVVAAGFASGIDLQGQTHGAAADFFDVAALLDHGEQDVVALVEQRDFVAHLFELQSNYVGVGLCGH